MKFFGSISMLLFIFALGGCGGHSPNQASGETAQHTGDPNKPKRPGVRVTEVPGPHSNLKIEIPPSPPPKHLIVRDIRKGSGPPLRQAKDEIFVNYVGVEYSTGRAFYDSWEQGGPSRFLLEETHKGWELGLKGMRAGGIRELITPPKLEYGTDTLIYVVELVHLKQAAG